jgi:hypothetical protein
LEGWAVTAQNVAGQGPDLKTLANDLVLAYSAAATLAKTLHYGQRSDDVMATLASQEVDSVVTDCAAVLGSNPAG